MHTTPVADSQQRTTQKKRHLRVPTAFTILFLLTVLAVGATWVIPAGQYAKLAYEQSAAVLTVTSPHGEQRTVPATQEELDALGVRIGIEKFADGAINKPISIPGTYERLESNSKGVVDVFTSMVRGTIEAADIIVFILVLGGLIGVVRASGAFEAGLLRLTQKTKGREFALVFLVSTFMAIGGSLCGLEEEAVAFYPILVPVFLALGYDAIICVGAIFLAGSMGTTFSTVNPFSVVIASNAAGIDFSQGIMWRAGGLVAGTAAVIVYLAWYAKRLKKDPAFSYTYDDREQFQRQWAMGDGPATSISFTWQRRVILILFVAAFVIMVGGVMAGGWWFPEMAASFLCIAIICMAIAATGRERIDEKTLINAFSEGSASLVAVSLIIGLARGINLIMNEGRISDTLLYASSNLVSGMNGIVFILVMMIVFFFLGFIVPSSSGLAVLSMPILAPLGDTTDIPRWIIVCAFQFGQYAMLFLAPTGLVMATLQMLDIKFQHWVRFVWPMVVFVLLFGGAMLTAQVLIYGG